MSEITVHRAPAPANQFMIVSNEFMRGELPVPLKALPRVLLGYFLSLPSGWRITRERIEASVVEGRDAVDAALLALEKAGYLKRSRRRGSGGLWVWTYAITDDPETRPLTESPSPEKPVMDATSGNATNPQVGPSPENPGTENQGIRTEVRTKKTEEKYIGADAPALPLDLPEQKTPRPTHRSKPRHLLPDNWRPNAAHIATAKERRWTPEQFAHEVEQFRNHWQAKGQPMADWDACFRTWTTNAEKWAKERSGRSTTTGRPEVRTGRMILET